METYEKQKNRYQCACYSSTTLLTSKINKLYKICFNSILINHKITYNAVMKKTPLLPLSLFWKVKGQCLRSLASLLTAINSNCHAALPPKTSAFNSHMRQNA